MKVLLAPSVLSADFGKLAEEIRMCEDGGADMIHIDVMDGCFVPNLTFGAKVIETIRKVTSLPLDVHLMVVEPQKYFDTYVRAGANILSFHLEAAPHAHRLVQNIRELGCRAGIALNPATPLEMARDIIADMDLLLVMTVNPGFGGQAFIQSSLDKVARARAMLDLFQSRALLEVDGGVGRETIGPLSRAGANTFVAGNAIFSAASPRDEIGALRGLCGYQA